MEGGSMPGVGAIHRDEINPTLAGLESALGIDMRNNALGSVNKREFSGDIDVAVKLSKDEMSEFINRLNSTPKIIDMKRGGVIMTKVKIVNYDPSKETNRIRTGYVQVDFMPGDPDWLKTYYHSPYEADSQYKGVHRNLMLSIIAASYKAQHSPEETPDGRPLKTERFLFSGSDGLVRIIRTPAKRSDGKGYTKQNTKQIIDGPWKTPDEIAKVLNLGTAADLDSFETLRDAIQKNYPVELVNEIMDKANASPQFQDYQIPENQESQISRMQNLSGIQK